MNDDMISVIEAGRQLERPKTTVFKIMKRLGIHPHKRRDSSRGNQVTAFITNAEFLRVRDTAGRRNGNVVAATWV